MDTKFHHSEEVVIGPEREGGWLFTTAVSSSCFRWISWLILVEMTAPGGEKKKKKKIETVPKVWRSLFLSAETVFILL